MPTNVALYEKKIEAYIGYYYINSPRTTSSQTLLSVSIQRVISDYAHQTSRTPNFYQLFSTSRPSSSEHALARELTNILDAQSNNSFNMFLSGNHMTAEQYILFIISTLENRVQSPLFHLNSKFANLCKAICNITKNFPEWTFSPDFQSALGTIDTESRRYT